MMACFINFSALQSRLASLLLYLQVKIAVQKQLTTPSPDRQLLHLNLSGFSYKCTKDNFMLEKKKTASLMSFKKLPTNLNSALAHGTKVIAIIQSSFFDSDNCVKQSDSGPASTPSAKGHLTELYVQKVCSICQNKLGISSWHE